MSWRYYVRRAKSGEWLDTNAQLGEPVLTWNLSAPGSVQAFIPAGLQTPIASDRRDMWEKWNTLLYAEEDGKLAWAGVCTEATPLVEGLDLEVIGMPGWLAGVDYDDVYRTWRTNVFDVIRHLINYSRSKNPGIDFMVPNTDSNFYVGDPDPPRKPREPGRRKGQTKAAYKASTRYKNWQKAVNRWNNKYKDNERYEIAWWTAPYVGEIIDSLVTETGIDYRERYSWLNKGQLLPGHYLDLADDIRNRRTDIAFVDGVNFVESPEPKNNDDKFANRVIALGAGEGKDMRRVRVGGDDGRLYQAQFTTYKSIKNLNSLRNLAFADRTMYNNTKPTIESLVVHDIPGFASLTTLRCGDEVKVTSENMRPVLDAWFRVISISRTPANPSVVALGLEAAV